MGAAQVLCHARGLQEFSLLAGREFAQEITQRSIDVWLIECGPVGAETAQRGQHSPGEALEPIDRFSIGKSTSGFKPEWIGEVVEGNERPDSSVAQGLQHRAVACESAFVPASR